MEPSLEDAAEAPSRTTRHLPVMTALWVRRFGQVMLAGVVLAGLAMPMPGYDAWGILLVGGLLAWLVWLLERLVWRHGRLPGNWIHLGLLGPAMILAGHIVLGRFAGGKTGSLSDGISSSLMIHLALLSLLVVLTQSFCASRGPAVVVCSLVGVAMMAVGIAGQFAPTLARLGGSLALIGLAGVGVCLWPMAGALGPARRPRWPELTRASKIVRLIASLAAGLGLMVISYQAERIWLVAALLAGVGGVSMLARRSRKLAILLAGPMAVLLGCHGLGSPAPGSVLGLGDQGFAFVTASNAGLAMLEATTGKLGSVLLYVCVSGVSTWILLSKPDPGQGIWVRPLVVLSALLATAALLVPGGYVSPMAGMAFAFCWGMVPMATGLARPPRRAWLMAGFVLLLMMTINLATDPGLLLRASKAVNLSDKSLHIMAGFVLAMVLAWWLGSWRWWAGLIMLAIAVVAGPAGEYIQERYTSRDVESLDIWAHVKGVSLAAGLYLVCVIARWAEASAVKGKPWHHQAGRALMSAFLRLSLIGLLVLLVSGWLLVASITFTERLGQTPPQLLLSDGIVAADSKSFIVPGVITRRDLITLHSTFSVQPDGTVTRNRMSTEAIIASSQVHPLRTGPNTGQLVGRPLSALAYDAREATWYGVESGETVTLLFADTLSRWEATDREHLIELLRAASHQGPVLCLDTAPRRNYRSMRERIASLAPEVICISRLQPNGDEDAQVLKFLRMTTRLYRKRRITVKWRLLTDSPETAAQAHRMLRPNLRAYIVTTAELAETAWQKTVPSVEDLGKCLARTIPSTQAK